MEAPLLPDYNKSRKDERPARERVIECDDVRVLSRPSVFFNDGVVVTTLDEDTYLRLLPYALSWISIPFLVMAIVILRPVTSHFIIILFLPSIISTMIFFALVRPKFNKTNHSLKIVLLCMMVLSCAQVFCDLFLALYVFVDGEYGRENEILNRDVFIGASIILCMAHILASLSLFTKFSLLLWTTLQ